MAWQIDDDLYVTRKTGLGIEQPQERLEVNGKIKTTDLQATGTVQALSFQGDGSNLTGVIKNLDSVVKKVGDIMAGPLKIEDTLTVRTLQVTDTISGKIDAVNITSGTLSVERIPSLVATRGKNIFKGTQIINGNLSVQEDIEVTGSLGIGYCRTYLRGVDGANNHWIMVGGDQESVHNALGFNPESKSIFPGPGWTFVQSSSKELKENIDPLSTQEAVQILAELNPVKFNYKTDNKKHQNIGFIAEDVPELLATSDQKGVRIMDIVGVLTKVLQEQQKTILELAEKVKSLEAKIPNCDSV